MRSHAIVAERTGAIPLTATMKIIKLTRGLFTIVDDKDYAWLNAYQWFAHLSSSNFYATRNLGGGKMEYMHRAILGFPSGSDHKNGMTLDNRRLNLRPCTQGQNMCNIMPKVLSTGGFIGVRINKGGKTWEAHIGHKNRQIRVGSFPTAELAAKARDAKAIELRGEFAVLNFPNGIQRTAASEIIQPEDDCQHDEHDSGFCLNCGKDITDDLVASAESASDARQDR